MLLFSVLFTACIGARHFVTFMLFLGMANAYIMRTNMSIAIVAMVNHTALPRDKSIPLNYDECALPGSSNETTPKVSWRLYLITKSSNKCGRSKYATEIV